MVDPLLLDVDPLDELEVLPLLLDVEPLDELLVVDPLLELEVLPLLELLVVLQTGSGTPNEVPHCP